MRSRYRAQNDYVIIIIIHDFSYSVTLGFISCEVSISISRQRRHPLTHDVIMAISLSVCPWQPPACRGAFRRRDASMRDISTKRTQLKWRVR